MSHPYMKVEEDADVMDSRPPTNTESRQYAENGVARIVGNENGVARIVGNENGVARIVGNETGFRFDIDTDKYTEDCC